MSAETSELRMPKIGRWIVVVGLAVAVCFAFHFRAKRLERTCRFLQAEAPAAMAPPVAALALPRLVDLGAGTCVPCKMMAPVLEELKREQAGVFDVEFIDVRHDPEAGKKFAISLIPTQIFLDAEDKELFRHEGFLGKEDILAKWRELGVEPQAVPASAEQNAEADGE